MKKAFDMVNHSELIRALDSTGVKGSSLEWFSTYLHIRYQIVQNGSFLSSTRAKNSYGTCDEVGRAKSSYGMSSSKILGINRLI